MESLGLRYCSPAIRRSTKRKNKALASAFVAHVQSSHKKKKPHLVSNERMTYGPPGPQSRRPKQSPLATVPNNVDLISIRSGLTGPLARSGENAGDTAHCHVSE
jgi:hypothetical protein